MSGPLSRRSLRGTALSLLLLVAPLAARADALGPDEREVLARARAIAAAPLDDFTPLGEGPDAGPDPGYRYQIAFLGYAVASVAAADPGREDECRALLLALAAKMERPKTLAYWRALGYEGDGLSHGNVMYRGHLALLYGLARDRFGAAEVDGRFHAIARALEREMAAPAPICCEPGRAFIQCNAVAALALHLHDRCYGTSYARAVKALLFWAREHMAIEGTALFRDEYHPESGASSLAMTGYANAWAIAYLAAVPEVAPEARKMYDDWRRTFVREGGVVAFARGAPEGVERDPRDMAASAALATAFGAIAAREMGDASLARKLGRAAALIGDAAGAATPMLPGARRGQARTLETIALFGRVFRGWEAVLGARGRF